MESLRGLEHCGRSAASAVLPLRFPSAGTRQSPKGSKKVGDAGPMGRILIRAEPGYDIVEDLYPADGERVIGWVPGSSASGRQISR